MTGLAGGLSAADKAATDANPYSVISDRNVFHLNPPPPPAPPPEPKPLDLPKVMLTAFVGKGSALKVYLAIPPKEAKQSIHYTSGMVPGEKDDDVELVRINYEKKDPVSVDILNSGTPQTLTLKSNTYLSSATAPPAAKGSGAPGMPPGIGLRHPPPGLVQPNIPAPSAPSAAATPAGGSSSVIVGGGGGSAIVAGSGSGNYASQTGGYNASSSGALIAGSGGVSTGAAVNGNNVGNQLANSLFNPQSGQYQKPASSAPAVPPEAQAAAMVIQRAAAPNGIFPPLPPPVQAQLDAAEGGGPPSPP
jgi:hypothetical protein